MNHRPITEDDLHGYVDRILEPERQAEVTAYLGDHPDVAKRVAAFTDQRRESSRTARDGLQWPGGRWRQCSC